MNQEFDRKLRIALLSAHSCPVGALGARDTGGMSVYIRELAAELDRMGHMVDIYTRVHDPEDPIIVPIGEQARVIHLRAGDEIPIHKLAIYSCLPELGCNLENFRKSNDLAYDVLFSHYWLSGYLAITFGYGGTCRRCLCSIPWEQSRMLPVPAKKIPI